MTAGGGVTAGGTGSAGGTSTGAGGWGRAASSSCGGASAGPAASGSGSAGGASAMRQEMPNSPTRRSESVEQAHRWRGDQRQPGRARVGVEVGGQLGRQRLLVGGEALPVLGRQVDRELVRDVDARHRDRLVVLHLAGQLAGELDRLQAAPKRPPEAALEESLDLLLDVAQEAHAVGFRSVADALAGTRRRRTRQGRMAHASTITAAGTSAASGVGGVRGGRDQRGPHGRHPGGAGRQARAAGARPQHQRDAHRGGDEGRGLDQRLGPVGQGLPQGAPPRRPATTPRPARPRPTAGARRPPAGPRLPRPPASPGPRPSPRPPPTGAPASAAPGPRSRGRAARGRSRRAPARRRAAAAAGRCASR